MNLHEYQSKQLLAEYGIATPAGRAARTVEEAERCAAELGGDGCMVKAQVHAGGRGKSGGVRRVQNLDELRIAASELLGSRLVTRQTTSAGQPVNAVLIEGITEVEKEYYLSLVVDRRKERLAVIGSAAGGMEIEEIAAKDPHQIITQFVDPVVGLQPYQSRRLAFALELNDVQRKTLSKMLSSLYRLATERDLSLVEINPLVSTRGGDLLALDAKIQVDDNALYRQPNLAKQHDPSQEDEKETRAKRFDLNYIALEGNIACMVNGAGLAMATMDLIKLHGGEPANFLDVGGGTTAERVAEAFKIIMSDDKVEAILVNIFGGIVRCDLIAEGIIQAVKETHVQVPVVVRLEGTNVKEGLAMLDQSGLAIISAEDLTDAARKVVSSVRH